MSYIEIKEYKENLAKKGVSKRYVKFFDRILEIYDTTYYNLEFNLKEIDELCCRVYNVGKLEVRPFESNPLASTSCVFCERSHASIEHYNFFRDVYLVADAEPKKHWYTLFW